MKPYLEPRANSIAIRYRLNGLLETVASMPRNQQAELTARRLVHRLCPNCRVTYKPETAVIQRLGETTPQELLRELML